MTQDPIGFFRLSERPAHLGLSAGEYAINPPGVWHTADVDSPVTAVFVTCGMGTQHKPR